MKTVQANLGHRAPSFTLKTYAHVSDRMQQRSADRMERLIGTVSGTAGCCQKCCQRQCM